MAALIRTVGLVLTFTGCWFCFGSLAGGSPKFDRVAMGGLTILFGMLIFAVGRIVADIFGGGTPKVIVEVRTGKKKSPSAARPSKKAASGDTENWLDGMQ